MTDELSEAQKFDKVVRTLLSVSHKEIQKRENSIVVPGVCSMQVVCKCEQVEMKRDMDLIRTLLIQMDEEPRLDGTQWLEINHHDFPGHSLQEVAYHVGLLVEVGYVRGSIGGGMPMISKLTWEGHEFVDDIKDSGIWANTKARVEGLSGVALSVVAEIAKAEIKKRLGLL